MRGASVQGGRICRCPVPLEEETFAALWPRLIPCVGQPGLSVFEQTCGPEATLVPKMPGGRPFVVCVRAWQIAPLPWSFDVIEKVAASLKAVAAEEEVVIRDA